VTSESVKADRPDVRQFDVELAAELVRAAGTLAAAMLADGLDTEHKTSVSDVVSAADRAAETLVVRRLRSERPLDGLIGEEGTSFASSTPDRRTWYIDPVDGTYNFLAGLPFWCSAVALAADASGNGVTALVGAVYHPYSDELWLTGPDHPTSCNGVPVPRLTDTPLSQLSIASYLHPATLPDSGAREPLLAAMAGAATVRMLGSGSIELASVAAGRLGAWVQHDSLDWDWLPGAALVVGAGGAAQVLHHRGHRWHIAGNTQAVAEIRQALLS
jgi:myo-inositol-1(or 4)-monophosphatase